MPRVLATLAVGLLAGIIWMAGQAPETSAARAEPSPLPFLAPWAFPSVERDTPPVVRERLELEQRRLFALARTAARLPLTRQSGCVGAGRSGDPSLGPPPPAVKAWILGHHVEAVFSFRGLPRSLACRPWLATVVVYSGKRSSSGYSNQVGRFRVRGSRGRVVVGLPYGGRPPYRLSISSETIGGRRGPTVDRSLTCPGTHKLVAGCLPGYRPPLHANPLPEPVLPIRGLSKSALEATLKYVLGDERTPPVIEAIPSAVECRALTSCEVTYEDPGFPASPYRVRYRIAGQQIRGCWMGLNQGLVGRPPFDDARRGRAQLAGCSSWLH
jgi:hypothetical protein